MKESELIEAKKTCQQIVEGVAAVFVGHKPMLRKLLAGGLANGHILFEDNPGLGKTLLAKAFAKVIGFDYARIQFTPDLLPADIVGTRVWRQKDSSFELMRGPIFTNILLADEINRTPPKTQAALLEVMQEKQVTIGGKTNPLPVPHYVLATQISLEQEGTYPLPEAQQDRFMLSVAMDYLAEDDEVEVIRRSTGIGEAKLEKIIGAAELVEFTQGVRLVKLPGVLGKYIVDLVAASRPTVPGHPAFVKEYIAWGAGLRASQNIALAAKALAAMDGRDTVTAGDIRKSIVPVLRHRIGLSFRAEVDRVSVEEIIRKLVAAVPEPAAV
jgi:MoxR-like ATPase